MLICHLKINNKVTISYSKCNTLIPRGNLVNLSFIPFARTVYPDELTKKQLYTSNPPATKYKRTGIKPIHEIYVSRVFASRSRISGASVSRIIIHSETSDRGRIQLAFHAKQESMEWYRYRWNGIFTVCTKMEFSNEIFLSRNHLFRPGKSNISFRSVWILNFVFFY